MFLRMRREGSSLRQQFAIKMTLFLSDRIAQTQGLTSAFHGFRLSGQVTT